MQNLIDELNPTSIQTHFENRMHIHHRLLQLFTQQDIKKYLELALGLENLYGNYSAYEHDLGYQILNHNSSEMVFLLATALYQAENPNDIIEIVFKQYNLPYLKVSVGSEMAMMLKPHQFWVANIRTIWTNYLVQHQGDIDLANEQLSYYRTKGDMPSALEYQLWRSEYVKMQKTVQVVMDLSQDLTRQQNIDLAKYHYLWYDCLANALYEQFAI